MAGTTDHEEEPRRARLEKLVQIEGKVTEAAEAAAEAAAHAVEATKAAEAASVARTERRSQAVKKTARAAKSAKTAEKKAEKAARAAKSAEASSTASPQRAEPLDEATAPAQGPARVLELTLTDAELALLDRMAADQDVPAAQLARTLLREALSE